MHIKIYCIIFGKNKNFTIMELFESIFNRSSIYETIFLNMKSVVEFSDINKLKQEKPELFKQWEFLCSTKYNVNVKTINNVDAYMEIMNDLYREKAIYYPEFSKIVVITYATIESKNGELVRKMKNISDVNEFNVISKFRNYLQFVSNEGSKSTPPYFPNLCGHNLINNDLPLYIKRLIYHRNNFEEKNNLIPYILKKFLNSKPWDNIVIDTLNLWKFNGISNTPIKIISDFLGLKTSVELMEMNEISNYYHENIEKDEKKTLDFISLQSANQTNLTIQLMNEMRIF